MGLSLEQMAQSLDWMHIFQNYATPSAVEGYTGSTASFRLADVAELIASDDGDNDGGGAGRGLP